MSTSPLRRMLGAVSIVFLSTLLGCWTATQWAASVFSYQAALGRPWVWVRGYPVYPPYQHVVWNLRFGMLSPVHQAAFARTRWPAMGGAVGGALLIFLVFQPRLHRHQPSTSHGTSHWASKPEVQQTGLLEGKGVILGQWGKEYLGDNSVGHVLVCAPTRSDKGTSVVNPTCLTWPDHLVAMDIKAELYEISAGARARFSRVLCFNPTQLHSLRFNFLDAVRMHTPYAVRDAQMLSHIIVDPDNLNTNDKHWYVQARNLLTTMILSVKLEDKEPTLAGVLRLLANPGQSIEETFKQMLRCGNTVIAAGAREMLDKADRERSSIISTALGPLSLWRDPVIARNTSASDFSMHEFNTSADPLSLYLVIPPGDIERVKLLIRMFLHLFGATITETLRNDKRRILLLLDEFPVLKFLDFYEQAISYLAGYKVKACIVIQSTEQLDRIYSPMNAFMDNCDTKVFYTANNERTAKRISDYLGVRTNQRQAQSLSGSAFSPVFRSRSIADQEHQRPLLTPDEILRLPQESVIILAKGAYPILAKKNPYYKDPRFAKLVVPPPEVPSFDDEDDEDEDVFIEPVTPYTAPISHEEEEEEDDDDDPRFKGLVI